MIMSLAMHLLTEAVQLLLSDVSTVFYKLFIRIIQLEYIPHTYPVELTSHRLLGFVSLLGFKSLLSTLFVFYLLDIVKPLYHTTRILTIFI